MLVDRAAELVDSKGKEAFSEFRQRGSEWFSGDTYIFAYAPDGTVVLNPAFPAREGHAYHGETDKKGKAFHDEIIKTAQTKGSGWVDYWLRCSMQEEVRPQCEDAVIKPLYGSAVKTQASVTFGICGRSFNEKRTPAGSPMSPEFLAVLPMHRPQKPESRWPFISK